MQTQVVVIQTPAYIMVQSGGKILAVVSPSEWTYLRRRYVAQGLIGGAA